MSLTILQGDALAVLQNLPEQSCQCCVTSPPYFGLRDYKMPGQLGIEKTPLEYVNRLVEIFREIRRMLKDDGTVWLNLGSSYFGSGQGGNPEDSPHKKQRSNRGSFSYDKRPNQSRSDAPACGTDDIKPQDCFGSGRACPYCAGELQDGSLIRRAYNARNALQTGPLRQRPSPIGHDNEHRDFVSASLGAFVSSVPVSTTDASCGNDLGAFCQPAKGEEARLGDQTSPVCAAANAHKSAYTDGTSPIGHPLVFHRQGTGFFCKACGYCATTFPTFKAKDLMNLPFFVAEALRDDGWYLRCDIIWSKPNPMPESVTDRPTRAHEYIFLLSKSRKYYYDHEAIKEPAKECSIQRIEQENFDNQKGGSKEYRNGTNINRSMRQTLENWASGRDGRDKQRGHSRRHAGFNDRWDRLDHEEQNAFGSNKRSVWTVAPACFAEAHFATFPPDLIKPCILAGSRPGDTVLDPFGGSGTTGMVALELGRKALLIELNPDYCAMAHDRCNVTPGLPLA